MAKSVAKNKAAYQQALTAAKMAAGSGSSSGMVVISGQAACVP